MTPSGSFLISIFGKPFLCLDFGFLDLLSVGFYFIFRTLLWIENISQRCLIKIYNSILAKLHEYVFVLFHKKLALFLSMVQIIRSFTQFVDDPQLSCNSSILIYPLSQKLAYRFKIFCSMLAKRTDKVSRKRIAFVNISANLAYISLYLRLFRLRLDVIEIVLIRRRWNI